VTATVAPEGIAVATPVAPERVLPKPRGRLFRKYIILFMSVVAAALLASGGLEIYFAIQEQTAAMARIQREQASGAASKIGQFVREVESQIGWTTQLPWTSGTLAQRQFDGQRLMRQVPAITELLQIDGAGQQRLCISRLGMDENCAADLSNDPRFTVALEKKVYYGQVYFRRDSEPYMTVAMSGSRRDAGVSIADVNLKFIWDVVASIKAGVTGQAYVIDADGRLVAHPDISLVLRNTDTAVLAQVRTARGGATEAGDMLADDFRGRNVIAAYAPIPELGWFIFVELTLTEALSPLYAASARTGLLLMIGLGVALAAGLLLARRMVVPIRDLQAGAARLGAGELSRRIDIKTGDELEALAGEFNTMAERLEESYTDLERKVATRTRELELASQHKSQFLANMSHELRTPMNAILSFTEMIQDGLYGAVPPKIGEKLERVQANGKNLLILINDVLDLSKIEAGKLVIEPTEFSWKEVIGGVALATESLAHAKRLRLEIAISPDLPVAYGDGKRLSQVVRNLVGNAIKFTERGRITVTAELKDKEFRISVADTGPGIPPEDHVRIFAEFEQVDSSSTRAKGGTGLGLAIAKRIVEMHRGRIWVDSALGKGSTFYFTLPYTGQA
jgi:two-component system, NtrC family, sensor kinase